LREIFFDTSNHLGDPTSNLEQLVQVISYISRLPNSIGDDGEVMQSKHKYADFLASFVFDSREVSMNKLSRQAKPSAFSHCSELSFLAALHQDLPFLFPKSLPQQAFTLTSSLFRGLLIARDEQVQKHTHANSFTALYLRALNLDLQNPLHDFAPCVTTRFEPSATPSESLLIKTSRR